MIFIIISLFCGFMILIRKGQKRFNWLICSMLLLASGITILDKPNIQAHRFFILCFWGSVLLRKEYRHQKFPLMIPLIIYAVGEFLIGWHAEDQTTFYKVWKPFAFLLDTYFVMLVAFWGTKNNSVNTKPIRNALFFFTIYGILTFVLRKNPIYFMEFPDRIASYSDYLFGDRLRTQSTWNHPIAYGFICSLFAVAKFRLLKDRKELILFLLLVINVLICGSRTALMSFILMSAIWLLMNYNASKLINIGLWLIPLLFLTYVVVPPVQSKIDDLVASAMGDSNTQGSSLDMRQEQTESVLIIAASSPVWGHGFDYTAEKIMGDSQLMNQYTLQGLTLLGFESYAYGILIDRGIVGVCFELLILISIFIYAFKNKKKYTLESSYIITVLSGFLFFSLVTGTLDTWKMTMLFIGICMRRISDQKKMRAIKLLNNGK